MPEREPISFAVATDRPRHPQQEIVDLLAAALLRLRARHLSRPADSSQNRDGVGLGFADQQRLNANTDHHTGVHA